MIQIEDGDRSRIEVIEIFDLIEIRWMVLVQDPVYGEGWQKWSDGISIPKARVQEVAQAMMQEARLQ